MNRIKELRKQCGLSQRGLSEEIGVSELYNVGNVEKAR